MQVHSSMKAFSRGSIQKLAQLWHTSLCQELEQDILKPALIITWAMGFMYFILYSSPFMPACFIYSFSKICMPCVLCNSFRNASFSLTDYIIVFMEVQNVYCKPHPKLTGAAVTSTVIQRYLCMYYCNDDLKHLLQRSES